MSALYRHTPPRGERMDIGHRDSVASLPACPTIRAAYKRTDIAAPPGTAPSRTRRLLGPQRLGAAAAGSLHSPRATHSPPASASRSEPPPSSASPLHSPFGTSGLRSSERASSPHGLPLRSRRVEGADGRHGPWELPPRQIPPRQKSGMSDRYIPTTPSHPSATSGPQ